MAAKTKSARVANTGMHRPLVDTHPELVVVEHPSDACEFRVENRPRSQWPVLTLVPPILALVWLKESPILAVVALAILGYSYCTQVLWESLTVFPSTGIQLATHKGIPGLGPLFVSRRFISLSTLSDVLINEGLQRWNVRYYLAAFTIEGDGVKIQVAYENILPPFPVLHFVYLRVHELLPSEEM